MRKHLVEGGLAMTIHNGTQFSFYHIGESIGVGGMGEVYRATDTNLKRDVAIKVLPESFAADADRLARFQREAEVLASLNHPNIAQIYGLEKADNITALVMELIPGPTLADRLEQGPLLAEEALPIAMQIIEALTAAHERGIVHRDLKPANLKLKADGTLKVLDFGIAKISDLQASSGPHEATRHTPAFTETGIVLGTAAYMSPEQARGKAVDQRADIWAFGCVLFEMLTGQAAFGGEDVSVTLARILERGADLNALPAMLAPAVKQTIALCLEKDVRKRVADIRDVKLALAGAFETGAPSGAAAARGQRGWLAFGVAAVLAVAFAIPALQHLRETPPVPPPPETRLDIVTPSTNDPTSFALSPDGRQIVFVASGDGESRLWLRSLSTTTAQPLPGTEGARAPFWSPDGRAIGFFADIALKRLDLGGGTPQTLAPVGIGRGGSWSPAGVIVFAAVVSTALWQVPATGGAVTAATTLGSQQVSNRLPHFLPDGRRFLFQAALSNAEASGIYLGSLDGSTPARLAPATGQGVYLPSGWLLWLNEGRLVAQRLDPEEGVLSGAPVTVADRVSAVSVSAGGLIAYRTTGSGTRQLLWLDREGSVLGPAGDPEGTISFPRVAPDGHRVAFNRRVAGNADIWLQDGARTSRLTFDAASDGWPIWSPDGTHLLFSSDRWGTTDLYQTLASGAGEPERIVASAEGKWPTSWSADGRYVLYSSIDPQTGPDLWVVPMAGERTPQVFLKTPYGEIFGAFSPDGRWVAYQSIESGRNEIYLRPFVPPGATETATGGRWQVSTAGGIHPVWRADGEELYYLNPAGAMMAVPVTAGGDAPVLGNPETLFTARIVGGGMDAAQGRQYDVSADGRFLINTELEGTEAPITLIHNWDPGAAHR